MKKELEEISISQRKNTDCVKWDGLGERFNNDELLPVWIADMDFKAPLCVRNAMHEYTDMGAFGYYLTPESYYESFINWEYNHHGYHVQKEWICFSPGIVSALHWLVNNFTKKDDGIIILSPVYYPFMDTISNTGRKAVYSMLCNNNGIYTIDFEDFESKIAENDVKLFIMSSPHNPVCRIWKREELKRLMDICKKHGVFVLSDEIHQDFEFNGNRNIPTATVGNYDDMLVTLVSPSKTFNLAGLQNSFIIIPDENNRKTYSESMKSLDIENGNSLGYIAAASAYSDGSEWLAAVLNIIKENYDYMKSNITTLFPKITISPLEGTYLMWLDFSAYVKSEKLGNFVQQECHFAPDYGAWFFPKWHNGDSHVRINLATSHKNIKFLTQSIISALSKL